MPTVSFRQTVSFDHVFVFLSLSYATARLHFLSKSVFGFNNNVEH
tara:strand:- start:593 stop:727 length:135 start_codon:yes stop_codon:yes gene_type:complete